MAYFPIVGRLDCESSSTEHQGFWQLDGYGIMSIYKSDWDRFGGKFNSKSFSYANAIGQFRILGFELELACNGG